MSRFTRWISFWYFTNRDCLEDFTGLADGILSEMSYWDILEFAGCTQCIGPDVHSNLALVLLGRIGRIGRKVLIPPFDLIVTVIHLAHSIIQTPIVPAEIASFGIRLCLVRRLAVGCNLSVISGFCFEIGHLTATFPPPFRGFNCHYFGCGLGGPEWSCGAPAFLNSNWAYRN